MDGSIRLTPRERKALLQEVRRSTDPQRRLRAHILLLLDEERSWTLIAAVLFTSASREKWEKWCQFIFRPGGAPWKNELTPFPQVLLCVLLSRVLKNVASVAVLHQVAGSAALAGIHVGKNGEKWGKNGVREKWCQFISRPGGLPGKMN
jgi:hypothetical protein